MTDDDDSPQDEGDFELALARSIRDLPREREPHRDLWPGIERRIGQQPNRRRGWWVALGVATSLVLGLTTFIGVQDRQPGMGEDLLSYEQSMDNMRTAYLRLRSPLVQEFRVANRDMDPASLEDLNRNVEIMEQARREVEGLLRQDPDNRHLVEVLIRLQAQELDLLRRDYMRPVHSM
jgi:hypothetical protein